MDKAIKYLEYLSKTGGKVGYDIVVDGEIIRYDDIVYELTAHKAALDELRAKQEAVVEAINKAHRAEIQRLLYEKAEIAEKSLNMCIKLDELKAWCEQMKNKYKRYAEGSLGSPQAQGAELAYADILQKLEELTNV